MHGSRWLIFLAAVSGFVCVGIGAMGAHSLPTQLAKQGFTEQTVAKKIDQCEIAVRYHMYHSLAILALGLAPYCPPHRRIACILFFAGILLFSGGLYSMVFFDRAGHWSIVPIGGTVWMIGWLVLAIGELFSSNFPRGCSES